MRQLRHLITSLVFAAHSLLGCGVHHCCETLAHAEQPAGECGHHHCCASCDDGSNATQPEGDSHSSPMHECDHVGCSFVKADNVQFDGLGDLAIALPLSLQSVALPTATWTSVETAAPGDLAAPHDLCVWHCALLI